ncbi:MAG: AmpG family muropeptide MFS transporter [Alphaproteobacteria bacterium]|nr:AmpG family muropeptide MFS transporter [Alphaproteobacteria bacterium]
MKKSYKNLSVIFLFGISSGLPLALILSTLKALLVESGFDLKTVGFFALVSLPYTLKFFFAPVIDSFAVPLLTRVLGQRRSWIIFTQLLLVIFIFALGAAGIVGSLGAIALFALLVGFSSASQDVVIDAYRIELIEKENQGFASGFYVCGYNLGMLISGAGALALAEIFSWDVVYFLMALSMALCIFVTFFADETRKNWQPKKYDFSSWGRNFVLEPILDFTRHELWYVIFAFVILFKLCDAFAGSLTLPFLLGIGFSKIEIAKIVKTFGLLATLLGTLFGGLLVKRLGVMKSLWIAGIVQMLSNLAFAYLAKIGYDPELLYFVVFVENFSGGIGSSVFVAYLSGLCNLSFSATQYALLSSLATFARSVLTASAGIFAQSLGWYQFFVLSTLLAVPGLVFLFWLTAKKE